MKPPRWMIMGVAVAGISSTLWAAAMPDTTPKGPEGLTKSQMNERRFVQERRERELRGKLREGVDADLRDRARPAEVRSAADDVAKALLRKAP